MVKPVDKWPGRVHNAWTTYRDIPLYAALAGVYLLGSKTFPFARIGRKAEARPVNRDRGAGNAGGTIPALDATYPASRAGYGGL